MDQKFVEMAKVELGETEVRKSQSLALFRDWLSKHSFLKNVRQGKKIVFTYINIDDSNIISTQTMLSCCNFSVFENTGWMKHFK